MDGFEEEWRRLIANARDAKAEVMAAEGNNGDKYHLKRRMYAANSAVRDFVEMERRIGGNNAPRGRHP